MTRGIYERKLIGKWHVAAFLVFCFVFALTASGVFYNQRGKLAGEFGNMVAANLTSYTQAQKRYLNSSITDAWNTLKGILVWWNRLSRNIRRIP